MPSLAIVIPYFKPNFFKETLESLSQQTDQNFHIYIGNDASATDPLPIIENILPENRYSYFNYDENKGGQNPALQWERILENVKEDFFMILGDDDYISDNLVRSFYHNYEDIEKQKINVIKFSQQNVTENGEPMNPFTTGATYLSAEEYLEQTIVAYKRSSLSEYIFRRSAYLTIGFVHLPFAWGTDNLAVFTFAKESPILFIENAKVFVRMSTANISGKKELQPEKQKALYQYHKYIINNLSNRVTKKTLSKLVKEHVYLWKYKDLPLDFNFLKVFTKVLDFRLLTVYILHSIKKTKS